MLNECWIKGKFTISTDKKRLDITTIYEFLTKTYWGKNRSYDVIKKSIDHSVCFGVYENDQQIGFARIFSDYATLSYLCDVFILPSYQKLGLGKWLVNTILNYDLIQGTHIVLATKDKHLHPPQY